MGNEAKKVTSSLGSFSFWTSKLALVGGQKQRSSKAEATFKRAGLPRKSKVTLVPSPLEPPGGGLNNGISQASCPEAAEQGYTQRCLHLLLGLQSAGAQPP